MKLLIVTQVVDSEDPVLGFFHRWIEEFSPHFECIEVICLREGKHALPENVRVHSLGKEKGKQPSSVYALRFLAHVWKLRKEYDTVFVHMNVEYVLLASWLWRLLGKRIALWYVHGTVSLRLRLAVFMAHSILTASPESCRVKSAKVRVVGHGIDTDFFAPDTRVKRKEHVLSVGRLAQSKRHDLGIQGAARKGRKLRIVGEGSERASLEALAAKLGVQVEFLGGRSQRELKKEYQEAAALVHTSETGSMDKVVLEALATNCPVITTSTVYSALPVQVVAATPEAIAEALSALSGRESAALIRERYSLASLIEKIVPLLQR